METKRNLVAATAVTLFLAVMALAAPSGATRSIAWKVTGHRYHLPAPSSDVNQTLKQQVVMSVGKHVIVQPKKAWTCSAPEHLVQGPVDQTVVRCEWR